jgi:uncharacterized protein (TIGR02284 family)
MSMTSHTADATDTIDTLNDLVEVSNDGERGFRTSAEHAESPSLRTVFNQRADECRAAARELQALVTQLGGTADTGGTAAGALHRGWVAVRSSLTGYSDRALLEECERGEDVALSHYRKALQQPLPESVRGVVAAQLLGVQRNHDQIRALRDRAREAG